MNYLYNMNTCKNCSLTSEGKYCPACGEKVIENKDFSLTHIFGQAIGMLTNLDSKLYNTLKLLFLRPGQLSLYNIQGIRVPYMNPIQIFLISNVIFFIFLSDIDIFRTPSIWFFQEDFDGIKVLGHVRQIMLEKNLTQENVAILYDQISSNLAKSLLIFLIPFLAIPNMVLHQNTKYQAGKHIIFTTHYLSFILILLVFILQLAMIFSTNKWSAIIPLLIVGSVYYIISNHRFYGERWYLSIAKGLIFLIIFVVITQIYKMLVNVLTLYTM